MKTSLVRHPLPWLLLATAAAYLNALATPFQFDDCNILVDNPAAHSLAAWWTGMPGIRPLLKLSYALNWRGPDDTTGYHAFNLLLHLVNIALVWQLARFFPLPTGWRADVRGARVRLLLTLLFALHPIQSEAVTYISGRSMSLMASFGLAGLWCWLEADRHARPDRWRLAALALFAAACLTKEVALVLPLVLFLMRPDSRPSPRQGAMLGLLVLALLISLFAVFGYQRLLTTPLPRGLGSNLASEANALFYLIGQLWQPHALNIDPDLPELSAWTPLPALQAGVIGVALILAWLGRQHRPWASFGIGWFLLLLLPTHSLIPRADLASERHLYLSGIGLYWLLGIALAALSSRLRAAAWAALSLSLAIACGAFTAERNRDYRDEISLWQATVQLSPEKARGWNNLGHAHALAGQSGAARSAFLRALALNPAHVRARANLRALEAGAFEHGAFTPKIGPKVAP